MTADDLSVYGKRTGSLWDRRIGGRYELVEITDNGGAGLWVTLQRVGGGHELAMSVYNLGRNYVPVPEKAEPAEDERRSDARRLDSLQAIVNAVDEPAVPEPIKPSDVPIPRELIENLRQWWREPALGVDLGPIVEAILDAADGVTS